MPRLLGYGTFSEGKGSLTRISQKRTVPGVLVLTRGSIAGHHHNERPGYIRTDDNVYPPCSVTMALKYLLRVIVAVGEKK